MTESVTPPAPVAALPPASGPASAPPRPVGPPPAAPWPAGAACPCGHADDEHDALAARYCRATVVGGLDRGCMCLPVPVPAGR